MDDLIILARDRFKLCVEAESQNRKRALDDLKFSEGDQWPDNVKRDRETEGRPCLVLNRIPAFIKLIINDIRQSSPAIKCLGVDSDADPETAEIINGIIRNIEQSSNAEIAYDWASEYAIRMGWGYYRIITDYVNEKSFEQDIKIKRISNPFSVYIDPEHIEPDGSDMSYCFIVDHLSRKDYEKQYPDAKVGFGSGDELGMGDEKWFMDDKVRIAEYWVAEEEAAVISLDENGETVMGEIEGAIKTRKTKRRKIKQYIINGHEILEERDWAGKYIPIIPVLGEELNIEGETVYGGIVRHMKDAQRQYNYWRSASTERVALAPKAPFIGAKGQFTSIKWRHANQKNYPYLEYDLVEGAPPPQRQTPPEISAGMTAEISMASDELKAISGIHDPSLGMQANEVSGVAIENRQRQSGITNFHYLDNLARAKKHTGRVLIDLIPRIYDTPRIVRITGIDGTERQVMVNESYVDEKQKPQLYDLQTGHYDVVIDVGPNYATQRQEAVRAMLDFVQGDPQFKSLIGDLIAKNSDWPNSDEVAKRLRTLLPADIEAEDNPQIKAMMSQMGEQLKQVQQYAQALEEELKAKDLELRDKTQQNKIKEAELVLKQDKQEDDYALSATELALKYKQDVPGDLM